VDDAKLALLYMERFQRCRRTEFEDSLFFDRLILYGSTLVIPGW
jgi:hypothetical protein